MSQRLYGRDYRRDRRDDAYLIRRRKASQRKSWHWKLGPLTDQGSTPHCVGHAGYGWLSATPVRQRPLPPHGLYALAQQFDEWEGTDYDGTSVRGLFKALHLAGLVIEYRWARTLDAVLNHVLDCGPMVIGVNWYEGMADPDRHGMMRVDGEVLGGHAGLVYGADRNRQTLAFRNSWGPDWGKRGNARISFADFERLLREDGEACTAIETRP